MATKATATPKKPAPAPVAETEAQAKKPGTALAAKANNTALEAVEYDEEDQNAGLDNIDRDEFSIPFFRILQSNSPQVENNDPDGSVAGMVINLQSGELFSGVEGVEAVFAARDHNFVEYVPRDAGGGFVGIRAPDDSLVKALRAEQGKFGKLKCSDTGNEISETRYLYGMFRPWNDVPEAREENSWTVGVIGFASTQIKKYQAFIGRVKGFKYKNSAGAAQVPPIYGHRWHLTTQSEKNKKGSFKGWKMQLAEEPSIASRIPTDHPDFAEARNLSQLIRDGVLKAAYEQTTDEQPGGGDSDDQDIPTDF